MGKNVPLGWSVFRRELKNADDNMNMAQDLRPLGPREEHRYSPALLSRLPPRSPPLLERNAPARPETRPASSGCGCPSPQCTTERFNIKSLPTKTISFLCYLSHITHIIHIWEIPSEANQRRCLKHSWVSLFQPWSFEAIWKNILAHKITSILRLFTSSLKRKYV